MRLELFVFITLVCSFIGIMLVRSRLNRNIVILLIGLAGFASIPIRCYLLDIPNLFYRIWIDGQLLVIGYYCYDLHNKQKPVRRYPGVLSKYKKNPNVRKWSSEELQRYQSTYLTGADESNKALLDLIEADMKAVRKVFLPYVAGMKGGHRVALYVVPNEGCLWDIEDKEGTWWRLENKNTKRLTEATTTPASRSDDYEEEEKVLVGYFYVN